MPDAGQELVGPLRPRGPLETIPHRSHRLPRGAPFTWNAASAVSHVMVGGEGRRPGPLTEACGHSGGQACICLCRPWVGRGILCGPDAIGMGRVGGTETDASCNDTLYVCYKIQHVFFLDNNMTTHVVSTRVLAVRYGLV